MFHFRRITLFCLEKRLSKHKMTIYSTNLWGGMAPLALPWLRLCFGPPLGNFLRTPLNATLNLITFSWDMWHPLFPDNFFYFPTSILMTFTTESYLRSDILIVTYTHVSHCTPKQLLFRLQILFYKTQGCSEREATLFSKYSKASKLVLC